MRDEIKAADPAATLPIKRARAAFPSFRLARSVPAEYRSNFIHLYFDVAWFGVLSGSTVAFLAVYAARQGANALQIGLLSASAAVINLIFALPAGRLLERQAIGPAVFWASVLHRFFYLLFVPLPVLLAPQAQVWALVGLTLLMSIPGTALAVGFNALFADAVPPEWRSHVVGVRNAVLAIVLTATSLICGEILAIAPFPMGYQIVFGIGFLGAAMSSLHLWFVRPSPAGAAPPRVGRGLGDMAGPGMMRIIGDSLRGGAGLRFLTRARGLRLLKLEVLRGPFGKVVATLFAFHLAQYLSIPLFSLYWVNQLHLSDQQISLGTALFQLMVFLGSTRLAYLSRRLSNHRITVIGALLMSTYPALTALSRGLELYLVAAVAGGLAWSLAGGALTNYILDRVPPDDRPAHLAWYNMALNAAILLGSVTGPLVADQVGLATALGVFAVCRALAALAILRWG